MRTIRIAYSDYQSLVKEMNNFFESAKPTFVHSISGGDLNGVFTVEINYE